MEDQGENDFVICTQCGAMGTKADVSLSKSAIARMRNTSPSNVSIGQKRKRLQNVQLVDMATSAAFISDRMRLRPFSAQSCLSSSGGGSGGSQRVLIRRIRSVGG